MQEVNAGGTLRLYVPKLAELQLNEQVRSSSHSIANLSWKLQVQHEDRMNVKWLAVFVRGDISTNDSNWSCEAEVRLKLLPQNADKLPHVIEFTRTFDRQAYGWGFYTFMKRDEVLDPAKGYLGEDGGIMVEATVTVTKVAITQTACDFSSPQQSIGEVALLIGEQRLHASKEYLAIFSPVFKTMFFGAFIEKEKKEIPLDDVDHDEFVELLHVIYPSRKPVTVDNVEFLLRLADRFDIQSVMRECEQLLCGDSKIPLRKKLLWAGRYRLAGLQFVCLNAIKTVGEAKMLKSTGEFDDFSLQMKEALLERILMFD